MELPTSKTFGASSSPLHNIQAFSVRFNPDNHFLASAGGHGTVGFLSVFFLLSWGHSGIEEPRIVTSSWLYIVFGGLKHIWSLNMWLIVIVKKKVLWVQCSDGWMDWVIDELILVGALPCFSTLFRLLCAIYHSEVSVFNVASGKEAYRCHQSSVVVREASCRIQSVSCVLQNVSHICWGFHMPTVSFSLLLGYCRLHRPGSHTVKQVGMPKDFPQFMKVSYVSKWFNPSRWLED